MYTVASIVIDGHKIKFIKMDRNRIWFYYKFYTFCSLREHSVSNCHAIHFIAKGKTLLCLLYICRRKPTARSSRFIQYLLLTLLHAVSSEFGQKPEDFEITSYRTTGYQRFFDDSLNTFFISGPIFRTLHFLDMLAHTNNKRYQLFSNDSNFFIQNDSNVQFNTI